MTRAASAILPAVKPAKLRPPGHQVVRPRRRAQEPELRVRRIHMRPLFVDEIAVHPTHHGRGIGSFILEQLEHLARVRGCTHLVLEVAENNQKALKYYRSRTFYKLDAAIFLAKKVASEGELLPSRTLRQIREERRDDQTPSPRPRKRETT